jgi:hypothetical protein
MGSRHNGRELTIGLCLALVMLVAGPAASALATAKVRLVNARPGSGSIGLKVTVGTAAPPTVEQASFGQVTPYAKVGPGTAQIALTGLPTALQGSAQASERFADGARYTVVALAKGAKGYALKVYRDGNAKAGTARLRVLHAAPELGAPNVRLGQRPIAEAVRFASATPYLSFPPGSYTLAVQRPGDGTIFQDRVALTAGVATTVVIAGTGGARERLIVATDDAKAPVGAPETGFGGLAGDGGPPWLLIALAALLAAALGGAAQLSAARRSGRR